MIILAAISGVVLVVLIVAFGMKSYPRRPLAQAAPDLRSTDEQAAALLAASAEAAYARQNAEKHMVYSFNYAPWL